ncbi:MAG: peptidase C39 family protein, partial [Verrucomicrobiota bacterium]
ARAQIRVTLGSAEDGKKPALKFLGLSFLDPKTPGISLPSNQKAWGKIIETPERSQNSYPEEQGWCSPTSLAMVLMRWSAKLDRPELNLDVRDCAAGVLDKNYGTGNWPFNTAFAGKFPGMRAYVTRFTGISELEDWIEAGIPVIISAPFHLLEPGRKDTGSGHVVTVIGFSGTGDVIINDPATNLEKGQKIRHTYKRENVIKAWGASHDTVYLIYPESAEIPQNRLGHWDQK